MTIILTTTRCHLCGQERDKAELEHDGRSFITCRDAAQCLDEVQRQGKAYEAAILAELQEINTLREHKINELVRVRHEYNLPDLAEIENRAEMARMQAE